MLTSQARETLRTVETVIVDEVHALAGSKRAPLWQQRLKAGQLQRAHRAFPVVLGGKELWAAVDDAAFLRDALGASIPLWADVLNSPASQSGQAQAPLRDPD